MGGGIVGCALAAFLAEDGARVRLYEREQLAAGASGRNSGLLQHPMDEALTGVYAASAALYEELGHGFELPAEAVGVLVVSEDAAALEPTRADLAARFPELRAEALDPATLHAAEPVLAEGLAAFRLDTGLPVPPAAATQAFAARARAAGAELIEGVAATPVVDGGRATGVRTASGKEPRRRGRRRRGPVDLRARRPRPARGGRSRPLWGVNVELRLAQPPRHAIEEGGIQDLPARRRRARQRCSASSRATASPRSGRRSCPSSPSRRRSRPRSWSAARASCPSWAARTSSPCGPARGR